MHQLKKKIIITGHVEAVTGLHIGGTNNSMSIGELDNAVIRNPLTKEPYLPGSSLKGKMRSLTEIAHATYGSRAMGRDIKNTPSNNPSALASRLFGFTGHEVERVLKDGRKVTDKVQQPSRVIVRDGHLKNAENFGIELYSEVKSETVIDRITSAAMPRQLERVPAGAKFGLEIIINVFSTDNEAEMVQGIFKSLELVQDDYLGGSGSRGSGQVRFKIDLVEERSDAYYRGEVEQPTVVTDQYQTYIDNLTPKATS